MSSTPNHTWYKIAESIAEIDISSNGLTEIEVNGKKVCVGLHNEKVFACTQKCPHAGGILANGYIDAVGHIVCPVHRYKFDPRNGRNISGEGYYLKTFPVDVRDDGLYIAITTNSIFDK